jgi:thiamine biosynthesis lipoprotein
MKNLKRRTVLAGAVAVCSGATLGSLVVGTGRELELTTVSGSTMGTYFRLTIPGAREGAAALEAEAAAIVGRVDRLMSTYRADSEVSRFNRSLSSSPVRVSKQTGTVIDEAVRVGALTGGAFDVTIGPLVELWGFGAAGRPASVPQAALVDEAAKRVGIDALKAGPGAVWKTRSDLAVDLSGIAKGYAVDRLAAMLDAREVPAYLVDIGGELRAKGCRPDGRPWRVGIERPVPGRRAVHRVLRLEDCAVATSGGYRNFFVSGGQHYVHMIDPRTAQPVTHSLASVTVIDRRAMKADALSTALMVMGPDEGLRFAERAGVAAYFVAWVDGRLVDRFTSAFEPWLDRIA